MSQTPNIQSKRTQQLRKSQKKPWDEFSRIPSCRMRPVCFHFHLSSSSVIHLNITWALAAAADTDFVAFQIFSPQCCRRGQKNSLQSAGASSACQKDLHSNSDGTIMTITSVITLPKIICFNTEQPSHQLDVWIFGLALRLFSQQSWCP